MKKLTALFIVLCITASLFALEEVRGVQTRVAKYAATEDISYRGDQCRSYDYKPSFFAGFELTNENRYPVWVEMELYSKEAVIDTKSITLKAGESYLWKVNIIAECQERKTGSKVIRSDSQNYFIKYKAYKAQ